MISVPKSGVGVVRFFFGGLSIPHLFPLSLLSVVLLKPRYLHASFLPHISFLPRKLFLTRMLRCHEERKKKMNKNNTEQGTSGIYKNIT